MSADSAGPDTIVLIHGFWVTPRSWEHWITHYESKGYKVIAPAYPGFEVEVEALNEDPTPIAELTVPGVVEHLEKVVGGLDAGSGDVEGTILAPRAAVALNTRNDVEGSVIASTFSHKGGGKIKSKTWKGTVYGCKPKPPKRLI